MKPLFVVLILSSLTLQAVELQPDQVCSAAYNSDLIVKTTSGETLQGTCFKVTVDEIQIQTPGQKLRHISRALISRVQMQGHKRQPMKQLGHGIRDGMKLGKEELLSPWGPLGIVTVAATAAWAAAGTPFCLVAELLTEQPAAKDIKILNP